MSSLALPVAARGLDACGARRVHHGSHAGRQLENRPHGRSLLGRRDRRTRGRRPVFVKAGTGGRHDSATASREHHFGMKFPLAGDRVPHRRTTSTPQHAGEWSLQGVTGVSSFFWRAASRIARLSSRVASGTSDRSSIRCASDTSATFSMGGKCSRSRPSRPEKVRTIIRRQEVMRPRGERQFARRHVQHDLVVRHPHQPRIPRVRTTHPLVPRRPAHPRPNRRVLDAGDFAGCCGVAVVLPCGLTGGRRPATTRCRGTGARRESRRSCTDCRGRGAS